MPRRAAKPASFFKVYLPQSSYKEMKLPVAFTLQEHVVLPEKAFLRDKYGNLWPVQLAKVGINWFFQDGWVKFLQDNTLKVGDFLVFHFDGANMFNVELFGTSACEKEGVGAFMSNVGEEQETDEKKEEENDVEVAEISSNEDDQNDDRDEDEDQDDEDGDANDDDTEDEDTEDIDYDDEDEEEDEEYIVVEEEKKGKNIEKKSRRKGTAIGRAVSSHKVQDVPESYGADIFKSGVYSQPKNPYFITKIRRKRRDELFIPTDVVKDWNLDLPEVLTIRDPEGRTKKATKTTWKDGRIWYVGGWRSICRWNLIEDGDRCICEFLNGMGERKGQADIYLQIHIVRAGATSRKC